MIGLFYADIFSRRAPCIYVGRVSSSFTPCRQALCVVTLPRAVIGGGGSTGEEGRGPTVVPTEGSHVTREGEISVTESLRDSSVTLLSVELPHTLHFSYWRLSHYTALLLSSVFHSMMLCYTLMFYPNVILLFILLCALYSHLTLLRISLYYTYITLYIHSIHTPMLHEYVTLIRYTNTLH